MRAAPRSAGQRGNGQEKLRFLGGGRQMNDRWFMSGCARKSCFGGVTPEFFAANGATKSERRTNARVCIGLAIIQVRGHLAHFELHPNFAAILAKKSARRVSHSQIVMTLHPIPRSAARAMQSRAALRRNLAAQNARLTR